MCKKPTFGYYKKLLASGPGKKSMNEALGHDEPELSPGAIKERIRYSRAAWKKIIKKYLGDKPEQYELLNQILKNAPRTLSILRDQAENEMTGETISKMEAIVRVDGSRPSFLVSNGKVNLATSPEGDWSQQIQASELLLNDALACTGRIDSPSIDQGFAGTGFLIHRDLVMTNRHVLQQIAQQDENGWVLDNSVTIEFGHEYNIDNLPRKRKLKTVLFCGSKPIKILSPIDHTKLDMALIELEPDPSFNSPRNFSLDLSTNAIAANTDVYTIGYPGQPVLGIDSPSLLDLLFKGTFGYKRLAPGKIIDGPVQTPGWTLSHDATTLGGNSGSPILLIGKEYAAIALHYGGRSSDQRVNWGHIMGETTDQTDGESAITLKEILQNYGVDIIDKTIN